MIIATISIIIKATLKDIVIHCAIGNMTNSTSTIPTSTLSISSKDVRLPIQLQRAMAAEAEATREARAKVRTIKEASESDDDNGNHDRTLVTIDNLYQLFVDTDDFDHIVTDDFSQRF